MRTSPGLPVSAQCGLDMARMWACKIFTRHGMEHIDTKPIGTKWYRNVRRWRDIFGTTTSSTNRIYHFLVYHEIVSQGSNFSARKQGHRPHPAPLLLCAEEAEPWLAT